MLLHYTGKLKVQIFCRHSADMEENAVHKLHLCTNFNTSTRETVYAECIYVLSVNRIFEILSIRRHSYFLFTARSAATWPPVNCACVPQLFQQLISTTLYPAFVRKFVCQSLCCVPLQIQTFYQNLVLIVEYHVD